MLAQKRTDEINENLNYFIWATIQCSVFVCFQLLIFSDIIIKFWLGADFIDAVVVMRIMLCSVTFFIFCGTMGNVLEASKARPINMINISVSSGFFLVIACLLLLFIRAFPPIINLSIAFSSSLVCLGVLTYISIRGLYPGNLNKDLNSFLIAIGINVLLGCAALLAKSWLAQEFYYLVIFEILIGVVYLLILWLLKTNWITNIQERLCLTSANLS
jgi:O-antigen/teichoic acid export membrane protein